VKYEPLKLERSLIMVATVNDPPACAASFLVSVSAQCSPTVGFPMTKSESPYSGEVITQGKSRSR
jgi:hypothetical protein